MYFLYFHAIFFLISNICLDYSRTRLRIYKERRMNRRCRIWKSTIEYNMHSIKTRRNKQICEEDNWPGSPYDNHINPFIAQISINSTLRRHKQMHFVHFLLLYAVPHLSIQNADQHRCDTPKTRMHFEPSHKWILWFSDINDRIATERYIHV